MIYHQMFHHRVQTLGNSLDLYYYGRGIIIFILERFVWTYVIHVDWRIWRIVCFLDLYIFIFS